MNGKVKMYDIFGILTFEGEYLKGKRNGKGKEFEDGELIFEGEYKNDFRIKGKEYIKEESFPSYKNKHFNVKKGKKEEILHISDELNETKYKIQLNDELISEYFHKRINKKGKNFSKNKIIFEGDYLYGKKYKGKEYYDNKLIFEGYYLYDKKIRGKEYIMERLEYVGDYLNGKKWDGKGYDENGYVIYELNKGCGLIREYYYDDKLIFEGEYLDGKRNGKGKEYCEYKLIFEGEYLNGERSGKGKEFYDDNLIYEGEYLYGKRNGKGKEYDNNELIFEGEYLNDKRWNGKGREYDFDSKSEFEGEFKNGEKWNGKIKEYNYYDELMFDGEYLNGKKIIFHPNHFSKFINLK